MMAVDNFFKLNGSSFRNRNRQDFNDDSAVIDKSWRKVAVSLNPEDAAELYGYPDDKVEGGNEETSINTD